MTTQVLTNSDGGSGTFASGTDELLDTARTYIASREDAFGTGLEIDSSHDETLSIYLHNVLEVLTVGFKANKDENASRMYFFYFACLRIFCDDRSQAVILALEFDDLSVQAYLYLG